MRHVTRFIAAAILLASGVLALSPTAAGACNGSARGTRGDNAASVGTGKDCPAPGQTPSAPGSNRSDAGPNCTKSDGTPGYLSYGGLVGNYTQDEFKADVNPEAPAGVWLHSYCSGEYIGFEYYETPPAEFVSPEMVMQQAYDEISPTVPKVVVSPDEDQLQLVNFPVWFWIDQNAWQSVSATAEAGGIVATVTAMPARLLVDPGDGSGVIDCRGPGTPYRINGPDNQSSTCSHTYKKASAATTVTFTVIYDVSWTSNIGAGGNLGTLEPTDTATLRIGESQAIVTGN